MREYRLAKWWRVITYLFCVGFIALAGYWLYNPLTTPFRNLYYFNLVGAFGLLFLAYYMYKDTRFGKFIIAHDHVKLISPFGTKTISLDAIKGYRKVENYLIIEPVSKAYKRVRVSTYLGNSWEIEEWLSLNFGNLDVVEAMAEEREIISNDEFGTTEEMRMQRLTEVKRIAKYVNRTGLVLMLWIALYPHPYTFAISLGAIFPLLTLGLCYYYRGMMKGGDKEQSAYPSVAEAFILPGVALGLRSLLDYNILQYGNGWPLIIIFTAGLFVLYHMPTGGFQPRKMADYVFLILFPIFTFFYSFGAVVLINCLADKSEPSYYETVIQNKRISKSKRTTYYLELKPWGPLENPEEVTVSRNEYERANISDTVTVIQKTGYLRMPWITVDL